MNRYRVLAHFVLALLVLTSNVYSQDDILVVDSTGYSILTTDANGKAVLVPSTTRFKSVIVFGKPNPQPDVPVPVPGPALNARALAIKLAALKSTDPNRNDTAEKLALLCSELAKRVDSGQLKGNAFIADVYKSGADQLMGTQKANWKDYTDVFTNDWAFILQEGGTDAQVSALLKDVSAGLNASITQFGDRKEILEMIIKLILQIILEKINLKGGL